VRRTLAAVMVLASACSPSAPKPPKDITSYLLRQSEAPKGTVLIGGDSGPQTLDEYAHDDPQKRADMKAAGFVTSYFELFVSPDSLTSGRMKPGSALAVSFALQFAGAPGAAKGLAALEAGVKREGTNVVERPAPKLGRASIELYGTLQKSRPPGFLIAWTFDKYVLGLIAVGAAGSISERSTVELAGVMAAHAGN
jgi:hypothetical protein